MNEIPILPYDGLLTPEVGEWALHKYRLVALYCNLFTRSMRQKWETLVYVDLFAGAGRSRVRGTDHIVSASPLIALSTATPFDLHIFCESNHENFEALKTRIARDFPNRQVVLMEGDANSLVSCVASNIPRASRSNRVLTFCFVDPFAVSNLSFDTIRVLSKFYLDFLILIPTNMEIKRNERKFMRQEILSLDRFLGDPSWREAWKNAKAAGDDFARFIVNKFGDSMVSLRSDRPYIKPKPGQVVLICAPENLRLYRLVMYSSNPLAEKFWKQAKVYSKDQFELGF